MEYINGTFNKNYLFYNIKMLFFANAIRAK